MPLEHDAKARIIIGGVLLPETREDLARALTRSEILICQHDEDDDEGVPAERDPLFDDNDEVGWWRDHLTGLAVEKRRLVLTVDHDYYTHQQHPLDDVYAFEEIRTACERAGLSYRVRAVGGANALGVVIDREVTTYTAGETYQGYTDLAGRHAVVAISQALLDNPDELMSRARRAYIAASWEIPPLEIIE